LPAEPVFAAEVLQLWSPPRLEGLATRLQQAARANQTWWLDHVKKAEPGKPLPYDARMGLSAAEYQEMIALADSVQMRPVATVQLTLRATPTGWRFSEDGLIVGLRGIEIDTTQDEVRTAYGVLNVRTMLQASDHQKATGRWSGPQWKRDEVDLATVTGTAATFAIGRLELSGQTLIYFNASEASNGRITRQTSTMLRLKLPASGTGE
jgi:hypothetical protein